MLTAHLPLGSHRCQETICCFFSQAAERRHPPQKKGFNNKQTRGRGYLNHAEKNPSGLDWLANERHVMLILHFTLQTITINSGGTFCALTGTNQMLDTRLKKYAGRRFANMSALVTSASRRRREGGGGGAGGGGGGGRDTVAQVLE